MNWSEVKLPENRTFGLFFSAIFACCTIYLLVHKYNNAAFYFALFSLITLTVSILKPQLLLPFNKLWMRFGIILGMIVSPVIIGLIFFVIFTPIGFVMRFCGRDELNLKLNGKKTYWKKKISDMDANSSFKNQF